jgi:signal transduction histidine kinase
MMRRILLLLLLFPVSIFAQQREVYRIDSLPKEGVLLDKGWKWHAVDNPEWSKPDFDDAKWEDIDPSKEIVKLTHFPTDRPLWLRIKLNPRIPKNYALSISQSGASEIYLNGRLIQKIGQIDPSNHHTIAYNPLDDHLILKLDSLDNTLAVRYYFQQGLNLDPIYNIRYPLFLARIFDSKYMLDSPNSNFWPGFNIGFAFILFFIHGVLFLYYPPLRANFWFSVYAFTNTLFSYLHFQLEINPYLERNTQYINFLSLMSLLGPICICYCIYLLLENKRKIYVYLFAASNSTNVLSYYFFDFETRDILVLVSGLFQALLLVAMALDANRVGDRRGMPVLYGTLAYVAFWSLFSISFPLSWSQTSKDILFHLATLSFPVTISALLGFKFRQVNQSLLHNLEQVNQLYVEKQQILANQNETLEFQVTERTTELSSKNRELEIEAALERIRSRTMEMQKSEELQKVTFVLYEQLKNLGFNFGATSITFMDAETGDMEWWMEGFGDEYQFLEKYHVKYFDHPVHIEQLEHWKKGDSYAVISLVGEEKKSYDKFYFNETDFIRIPEKTKELMMQHEAVDFSMAYMQYGALSWSPTPLSDEQAKILQRFAKVFEQTYTRFLDLQKAEAQAREAQIEAALERVRSSSMKMHQSKDLVTVINVVAKQLLQLNIQFDSTSFFLNEDSEDFSFWLAAIGDSNPDKILVPKTDNPVLTNIRTAQKKGLDFFTDSVTFEEKNAWFNHVFNHSAVPEERKKYLLMAKGYERSVILMKQIGLFVVNFIPKAYTDEENAIFRRFAYAFEQAYTRFLDLQNAEAQTREVQIEVALEKIRSRSLAMHHSSELKDVISIMFEKLKELNVLLGTIAIVLFDEKTRDHFFWIGNDLHEEPPLINLPYDENIFDEDTCSRDCWQARLTGEGFMNKKYSFEQKNKYFEYVFANNNFDVLPQPVRDYIMQAQEHIACFIVENNSTLFVDSWDGQTYSDEMLKVIKRAAAVFEQAFVRFLDLQKAEAQAREAQVEAALERVRARAMSMQTSEEINAVIGKIFTECKSLEIQLDSSIIIIYDKQTLDTKWHLTNNEDPDYPARFSVPYNEYPFNAAMLNAWHQKTLDWGYILDVQEKKDWDQFMFSKTDFVLLPENIKEVMAAVEKLYIKASFNEFGCIMLSSLEPFNNEQMAILPRFSKVFELTYTRFNDLKIAEAQAEQAKLDLIQIQTEKKKAEDTLVELRATQAQLIQSEKLASLGELTAGIAHEIQNPLNFVNNFSELSVELLEEMETEFKAGKSDDAFEIAADLKQNLSKINHHGQRASAIVKGMLEHSRTSTGTKVTTDINALADEYLRLTYHGLRAKDSNFSAAMETRFDPDLPHLEVVPQDIGRVILNLINNAFYAANEKAKLGIEGYAPTVTVNTKKLADAIEISIKDNGNGIPDAIKDKIFQPFFTTKPTGQGTGLGLSLAYDIVTKGHGGSLAVESTPGDGTSFVIQLPINETNL